MFQADKKADEVIYPPFIFDTFSEIIGGDTIASATLTATPSGLTIGNGGVCTISETTYPRDTASVLISGGTAGVNYYLSCHAVFASGVQRDLDGWLQVVTYLPD